MLHRIKIREYMTTLATNRDLGLSIQEGEALVELGCEVLAALQEVGVAARLWRQAVILQHQNPEGRLDG